MATGKIPAFQAYGWRHAQGLSKDRCLITNQTYLKLSIAIAVRKSDTRRLAPWS